jgi:radical SAM protein with 4Fe4S-binding SPASM domain
MHKDFPKLLKTLSKWDFRLGIMTNGTMLTPEHVTQAKDAGAWVQVSIDGGRTNHDKIRGDGNYAKAISGIQMLVEAGIHVALSFTATKYTYEDFFIVADLGHELGVNNVWTDRVISAPELELDADQMYHYAAVINRTRTYFLGSKTSINAHRALQFLVNGGLPYSCGVGRDIITVMPNGDVMGCRRLDEVVGNVKDSSLSNYHAFLGSYQCIPKECNNCKFKDKCRGGLKCQGIPDPGCWLLKEK